MPSDPTDRKLLGHLVVGTVDPSLRGTRLREAVYGTVVVLSVLTYLDEHPVSAGSAIGLLAGTTGVLLLARGYAELIGELLDNGRAPHRDEVVALGCRVWPVAAVALPPLLLLGLAATGAFDVDLALGLSEVLGALSLGAWGWAVGRIMRRGRLTAAVLSLVSLVLGLFIVSLKATTG